MTAIANIIKDRKVYLGGVDLSGDENEVSLAIEFDQKECTTFPDSSHVTAPGLAKITLDQKGFVTFGEGLVDETLVARLGTAGVPVSVTQKGGVSGEIAYFTKAWGSSYAPSMKVGELPSFDFSMSQDAGEVIRGTILIAKTMLAAGEHLGTAFHVGAVPEGKKLFAALHVFDVASGSVDVVVQCDDAEGMASPTDKITFAQHTDTGSEFKSAAGPITDSWWRVKVTVVGTATIFVVVGIV